MHPSLHNRVFVSNATRSLGNACNYPVLLRPHNYKAWTGEAMRNAMRAVIDDGVAIRKASEMFNIPKSTLGDRISGRVLPGTKSGPSPYLSYEEEVELATFLCRSAEVGYGRTRKEVIAIVERILLERGIERSVTSGWWESFVQRHPHIALRAPALSLSYTRANASDRDYLDSYFDVLDDTLKQNDLLDKPLLIFNMDETGMALDPKSLKVVHVKGCKNPAQVSNATKTSVTAVGCVSAGGQCMPPMIIWNRKTLPPELAKGEVPGTLYGLSAKGWIDQELFHFWFLKLFLAYAPPSRPLADGWSLLSLLSANHQICCCRTSYYFHSPSKHYSPHSTSG